MIKSKEEFLKELVTYPELKDNVIAYVFAANPDLNISDKTSFFDNVKNYYEQYKNQKPDIEFIQEQGEDEIEKWKGIDLRIKSIRLKSVRGFPKSELPFGVDLVNEKDEPQSMVILGGNATGKSSLYDAIEFVYCDAIGEAQLRHFEKGNEDRYRLFLGHFENGIENTFCVLETVDKKLDLQESPNIPESVKRRINPNTHFISDYDVYENGQLNYEKNVLRSFHNQIAKSIGLEDLLEFNKRLKAFVLYRRYKESKGINASKKNIETQKQIVETNNKAIAERKVKLEQLKKNQKANPEENAIKGLIETLGQLKQNRFSLPSLNNRIKESKTQFENAYTDFVSKQVKSAGLNELQFLNLGKELLNKYENCPFCENSKSQKDEIKSSVNLRIERIKSLNEAAQKVQKAQGDIVELITHFYSQLNSLKNAITREMGALKDKAELSELNQKESIFLGYLSNLLANDFFTDISNFEENPNYLKDKSKYVAGLLKRHSEFLNSISEIESKTTDFFEERNGELQKIDDLIKSKTQTKSVTEQIIELNKEVTDFEAQVRTANQVITTEQKNVEELEKIQSLFNEIKEATKEYEKHASLKINEAVNVAFNPIKLIVEEVLETYFKMDNRNIDLIISKVPDEYDEETGEILSEVITAQIKPKNQNIEPQAVGKILNTFHYRLFSTMVGIAIAIASRKNTQINLPLVLDDIFYASDFENRATVETFIEALFKMFGDFTPELPLQLILFTHDQLIFESAVKVLSEKRSKHDTAFAKLFPHSVASKADGYNNIIYKFPVYYPNKLINKSIKV
ncbi:hypothetical protein SAMN05421766_104441 [Zobellia uliginosa]|uniref:AAA domain-containing protein n=1 Tax=Zobellia uliginosa TaxID=143224 RepID=A0ABY1KWD0_9FLAO|nr:hypothetical protein [Zobellia uliginosa]SIS86045.1 hypothetical protein SAMN05421766_104441 [Zobellia uliginosa]